MSDDNRNMDDDRRKNGDFKMPSRNWIVWILILCCVLLVVLLHNQYDQQGELVTQAKFTELSTNNLISHATIKFNPQSMFKEVSGTYFKDAKKDAERPFRAKIYLTD